MPQQLLTNAKILVFVESQYIAEEIRLYQERFAGYGATVDLASRLWGESKQTFVSEVEHQGQVPETLDVDIAIEDFFDHNGRSPTRFLADYAAVVMSANYTSVRLRYYAPPHGMRTTPAVRLFAEAMTNPRIIKGALCHGLWILTPRPDLLAGRRVIGHEVLHADIVNAGGVLASSPTNVVVDRDLVTGKSFAETIPFIDAILQEIVALHRT